MMFLLCLSVCASTSALSTIEVTHTPRRTTGLGTHVFLHITPIVYPFDLVSPMSGGEGEEEGERE
jgi:hypothetical protein